MVYPVTGSPVGADAAVQFSTTDVAVVVPAERVPTVGFVAGGGGGGENGGGGGGEDAPTGGSHP